MPGTEQADTVMQKMKLENIMKSSFHYHHRRCHISVVTILDKLWINLRGTEKLYFC